MAETEVRAAEKTRAFYIRVFFPWAKEHHVSTHPGLWYLAESGSREDQARQLVSENHHYRRNYESMYDAGVLCRLVRERPIRQGNQTGRRDAQATRNRGRNGCGSSPVMGDDLKRAS